MIVRMLKSRAPRIFVASRLIHTQDKTPQNFTKCWSKLCSKINCFAAWRSGKGMSSVLIAYINGMISLSSLRKAWSTGLCSAVENLRPRLPVDKSGSLESWCKTRPEGARVTYHETLRDRNIQLCVDRGFPHEAIDHTHVVTPTHMAIYCLLQNMASQKLKEERLIWCKFRMGNHEKSALTVLIH